MKYMGSKNRIANEILPIILKNRKNDQWYVEPFAGGMNVIDKVNGKRIASDNNKYLISMWKSLMNFKDFPKDIDKDFYDDVRRSYNSKDDKYQDDMIGWVGFMASANGRFFDGGYSGISNTKDGKIRNYINESIKNIEKQIKDLRGTIFKYSDYKDLNIPNNSIIYCDIPYNNTKKYATSKNFNYDEFWDWVRVNNKNNDIFISEYEAPDDFECIWEKNIKSSLSANGKIGGNKNSIEKLFKLKK